MTAVDAAVPDEDDVHPDIAAARRDPRLEHGRDAMIADWWAVLAAAERARRLAEWGLIELEQSLKREEARTGYMLGDLSAPGDVRAELEAAHERSQLAEAEADNQMAEINAMTLVTLVGALDGMVETLAPSVRQMQAELGAREIIDRAKASLPAETRDKLDVPEEAQIKMYEITVEQLLERAPKIKWLQGAGAKRWEDVLADVGLKAPADRQIPDDMDQALQEIVALRHVIAHRASRVDVRALKQAPSLAYEDGDLVRLGRLDYRRYVAALRTYADEVIRRLLGPGEYDMDIADWQMNVLANT